MTEQEQIDKLQAVIEDDRDHYCKMMESAYEEYYNILKSERKRFKDLKVEILKIAEEMEDAVHYAVIPNSIQKLRELGNSPTGLPF